MRALLTAGALLLLSVVGAASAASMLRSQRHVAGHDNNNFLVGTADSLPPNPGANLSVSINAQLLEKTVEGLIPAINKIANNITINGESTEHFSFDTFKLAGFAIGNFTTVFAPPAGGGPGAAISIGLDNLQLTIPHTHFCVYTKIIGIKVSCCGDFYGSMSGTTMALDLDIEAQEPAGKLHVGSASSDVSFGSLQIHHWFANFFCKIGQDIIQIFVGSIDALIKKVMVKELPKLLGPMIQEALNKALPDLKVKIDQQPVASHDSLMITVQLMPPTYNQGQGGVITEMEQKSKGESRSAGLLRRTFASTTKMLKGTRLLTTGSNGGSAALHECVYTHWTPWSLCSLPCGNGTQTSTRQVVIGGSHCQAPLERSRPCNTQPCSRVFNCSALAGHPAACAAHPDCITHGHPFGKRSQPNQTKCTLRCHIAHTTQMGCTNDPQCDWSPAINSCGTSCSYPTQRGCESSSACTWNKHWCSRAPIPVACSSMTPAECANSTRCVTQSDSMCVLRCHLRYVDELSCEEDPACEWHEHGGVCQISCGRFLTEHGCDTSSACRWNTTLEYCTRAPATHESGALLLRHSSASAPEMIKATSQGPIIANADVAIQITDGSINDLLLNAKGFSLTKELPVGLVNTTIFKTLFKHEFSPCPDCPLSIDLSMTQLAPFVVMFADKENGELRLILRDFKLGLNGGSGAGTAALNVMMNTTLSLGDVYLNKTDSRLYLEFALNELSFHTDYFFVPGTSFKSLYGLVEFIVKSVVMPLITKDLAKGIPLSLGHVLTNFKVKIVDNTFAIGVDLDLGSS